MSKIRLCLSLLLLFLLLMPLVALAQEDEDSDWVEFTSEDEVVSILHPAEWVAYYDETEPNSLYLSNSQELMDRMQGATTEAESLESGDQALLLISFPASLLSLFEIELEEGATLEDLTAAMVEYIVAGSADSESSPVMGEVVVEQVSDDFEIGYVTYNLPDEDVDGVLIVYMRDEIITLGTLTAFAGEYNEDLQQIGFEMAASHHFNISVNELEGLLVGAPDVETTPSATEEAED